MKKVLLSLFMVAFLLPFASQAQTKVQYDTIITYNEEACDSYEWINGETYTKDTIVMYVNATNDTLHVLNLTVWESKTKDLGTITTTCGYRFSDGSAVFNNGVNTKTLKTIHQCDSVITLTLNLTDQNYSKDTVIDGCLSYKWHGQTYRKDTTFMDTISHANEACDTIFNVTLNINQHPDTVYSDSSIHACDRYTYRPAGIGRPETWTEVGEHLYNDVFPTNRVKCQDSIRRIHITLDKAVHNPIVANACGSYTFNDVEYTTNLSKKEIRIGFAANKCDSIVDLTLTIHPYPVISIGGDWELEVGDNATLYAECDIEGSTYKWSYDGKTSTKDTIIIENIQNNIDVTLNAKSPKGCESTTWLTVTSYVSIDGAENASINIYPNPTSRFLNIESNSEVQNVAIYNIAGQQVINTNNLGAYNHIDLNSLTSGTYTIRMTLENGTIVTKKFIVNK